MFRVSSAKNIVFGAAISFTLMAAGSAVAVPAMAAVQDGPSGFGQVAAAPVGVFAPIDQLVGTVGAPLVNVNIPCPAPWQQGGLFGSRYNACNTAFVDQGNGY